MLTIAYDGTDFCGWQKQEPYADSHRPPSAQFASGAATERAMHPSQPPPPPSLVLESLGAREGETRPRIALRTVQAVVERAVREIVREPVHLQGSSRTDAGVHAWGQVAAFTCSGDGTSETASSDIAPATPPAPRGSGWPLARGLDRLVRAVNSRLPDDVLITDAAPVVDTFDPTNDAVAKSYSYTLHQSETRALRDRRFVHQLRDSLDVAAMNDAAQHLVGEHDFVSFAALHHGRLTTVRTVFSCDVREVASPDTLSGRRIRIDVAGSGFLYNMVRIIAGTLVEVGRGRMSPTEVPAILAAKDRRAAGPTLPPTGLCLEWIRFAPSALIASPAPTGGSS